MIKRTSAIATILFLTFLFVPHAYAVPSSAEASVDKAVQDIQVKRKAIDDFKPYRTVKVSSLVAAKEGNAEDKLVGYFDGDALKEITSKFFGEKGSGAAKYYFDNDRLIFVSWHTFRHKGRLSKEENFEGQYYFEDGKLIRWTAAGDTVTGEDLEKTKDLYARREIIVKGWADEARRQIKGASGLDGKGNNSPTLHEEMNHGTHTVSRVIDGDILKLSNGERVRLIGVDTPESRKNAKLRRDAKRTGQGVATIIKRGKEAAKFTRQLVEGRQVRLEYDVQKKDKYGKTLAYVMYKEVNLIDPKTGERILVEWQRPDFWVDVPSDITMPDDGYYGFLNAMLIKAGYAQVMTIPPDVKHQDLFVKLEKEAREAKRGLWA